MEKEEFGEGRWISGLIAGDREAFSKLYELHSPSLLHKLNQLLPDEDSVLEIHQISFVRLWDMRERILQEHGVWPLLHTIARNLVVDYFRKSASNEAVRKALLTQATLYYEMEDGSDHIESMTEALSAAIDRLPSKRKEIFLYCKFQGKSYEEAAEAHGVSVGTIKDHMAKAMRFLKSELGEKLFALLVALVGLWVNNK
ncbi:RNA polymerase sigma factor [Sphingobacterium faecale]|uniref:Sigma-70 family RNA polymerase sigma factor n=1 Tax=Sphingobacterium faecale TaxID=2803775 RepID=A0ABS1R7M1_9SPHI|nr:sigma-70 family RNA polymerase sigma factor [Sphingobacterium faecale]MBL1410214.1 sigma-70 family RNA polymerase sigma factor [Sphingobacterium faecale]